MSLHLVDSIDSVIEFKNWAAERRETPLAFDTESAGLNPERDALRLIQLGDMRAGWAFPPEWSGAALEVLRRYDGELVAHNLAHDYRFLLRQAKLELPWHKLHDTFLLASLDDPMRPRGLKPLSKRLVDPRVDVWQRALDDGMKKMKWDWGTVPLDFGPYVWYSALDPVLTAHLWKHLHPRVARDCPEAYDLELGVNRVCTRMMLKGIRLDREYVAQAREKLVRYAEEARLWLDAAYEITSVLSAKQISAALAAHGELPTAWTPTGLPKMDKEFLSRVKEFGRTPQAREIAEQVLGVRHAEKMISAYLENFTARADADGIVRCSIWQAEAVTGRMSITEPALQTLSRDDTFIRGSFVPGDGNVFISCDYSQIEARLAAHFARDAGMIATFAESDAGGPDFFAAIASQVWDKPVKKSDQERQLCKNIVYGCVPLDTLILTKRGLLKHDEVSVGDLTVGYNPATGRSEWTEITAVHHYPQGDLLKGSTRNGLFVCTPDHRWYGSRRVRTKTEPRTEQGFFLLRDINSDVRVILAAPLETSARLPLTVPEAALLGWMLTDGRLTVTEDKGAASQSHGSKRSVLAEIRQSVAKHAAHIDSLLEQVPAALRDRRENNGYVTWHLRSAWARDLATRAGFYAKWPDAVEFAASLSSEQSAALLDAMQRADGNPFNKASRWVLDLYSSLTYFSGMMPCEVTRLPGESSWQKKQVGRVYSVKAVFTGSKLKKEPAGSEPVWCVTTTLGTWTMQQTVDGRTRTMMTGNSIFGAGVEKMAHTAGVPVAAMKPVKDAFDARFPGLKEFTGRAITEAKAEASRNGRPAVRSGMGRYLPVEPRKEYVAVNRLIQSEAAEVLKRSMLDLDAAGFGDYMLLPIHDEILFEIPAGEAEEARKVIAGTMEERKRYLVPLTASAEILPERWVKA